MFARSGWLVLFVVAVLSLSVARSADEKPASDEKLLEGEWKATSFDATGDAPPTAGVDKIRLTFTGDSISVVGIGDSDHSIKFKLDATKSPKTIDFTPEGQTDKVLMGIYSLEKDTLKICCPSNPGGERPSEFKAPTSYSGLLLVLERVKK